MNDRRRTVAIQPATDIERLSHHPFIVARFATDKQPSECILRQISILDLFKQIRYSRHALRYPLHATKSFDSSNLMIRVGGFDMVTVCHHDYC